MSDTKEVRQLKARIRKLEKALTPFAEAARIYALYEGSPCYNKPWSDDREMLTASHGEDFLELRIGHFRAALAVRGTPKPNKGKCPNCEGEVNLEGRCKKFVCDYALPLRKAR